MKLDEYIDENVVIAYKNDTIATVCNLMLRYNVEQVLVVDEKPIGIVSKKNIAKKLLQTVSPEKRRPVDKILVEKVMDKNLSIVDKNFSLKSAAKKVLNDEYVIVCENNEIVGLFTKTSAVKAYVNNFKEKFLAENFLNNNIPTVNVYHSINKVLEKIFEKNSDRAIVLDKGKLVGIVSLTDLALVYFDELPLRTKISKREFYKMKHVKLKNRDIKISEIMVKKNIITATKETDLAEIGELMLKHNISSIPIIENETYIGVITKNDIIKALLRCL